LTFPLLTLLAVIMEFISSFISFLVGYYAMKGYRKSSLRGLLLLYWGFTILGVGILLRGFTITYVEIMVGHEGSKQLTALINLAGLIYSTTQVAAYAIFVADYALQSMRATNERNALLGTTVAVGAATFPVYRLFFIPWLELLAICMLSFVTVNAFINWSIKKTSESALVVSGFGLILLSHVFFLLLPLRETLLFVGQAFQLAGFICLVGMLAKVSRTNEQ